MSYLDATPAAFGELILLFASEMYMLNANECREHAERCMTQAAETTDPIVKERLIETAQGWMRLAADFENYPDRTDGFWVRLKRSA